MREPSLTGALEITLEWLRPGLLATLACVLSASVTGNLGNEPASITEAGEEFECTDQDMDGAYARYLVAD